MFAPEERVALRILVRELGVLRGLLVGIRTQIRVERGAPFAGLDAPETEAERESREQIGPAIVLYEELSERVDDERAYEITEEVVVEGALIFLSETIGELNRDELAAMSQQEREQFVRERGAGFHNATITWDTVAADEVEFTVTSCRFVRLCQEAGVPEIAPMFCAGDAEFFGGVEEDVELDRPRTIADGADTCKFHLQWADEIE